MVVLREYCYNLWEYPMSRSLSITSTWGLQESIRRRWGERKAPPSQPRGAKKATKRVLLVLAKDESRSIQSYRVDIQRCIQDIIRGCSLEKGADDYRLMHISFGDNIQQHHDFKPLNQCQPDDYVGQERKSRSTALSDAIVYAVNSLVVKSDYMKNDDVSGIVLVLSDGRSTKSSYNREYLRRIITKSASSSSLRSLKVILIGVGDDPYAQEEMEEFCREAGIAQYVSLRDVNHETIAMLISCVHRNIMSQRHAMHIGREPRKLCVE